MVACILFLISCGVTPHPVEVHNIKGLILGQNDKFYHVFFKGNQKAKKYCTNIDNPVIIDKKNCKEI